MAKTVLKKQMRIVRTDSGNPPLREEWPEKAGQTWSPGSLVDRDANGYVQLTSGDDATIIDIQHPATSHQAVAFTKIQGVTGGLDDVIKHDASAGTFYISDTADNRVLTVHMTGLNPNDYYASVGNAFGQVDPLTGIRERTWR